MVMTAEIKLVLWGVVAQWVTIILTIGAYYLFRVRHDARWKGSVTLKMSSLSGNIEKVEERISSFEYNRRRDDKYNSQRDDRLEKVSAKIGDLKEGMAALKSSNESLVKAVDHMMEHILKEGG